MSEHDELGSNLEVSEIKIAKSRKKEPEAATTVKIVLEENDDIPPNGLFLGVNGRGYLVQPGEPVTVPKALVEVLDHAIMSVPQVDPQTRQVVGWRDRLRYPYRLITT